MRRSHPGRIKCGEHPSATQLARETFDSTGGLTPPARRHTLFFGGPLRLGLGARVPVHRHVAIIDLESHHTQSRLIEFSPRSRAVISGGPPAPRSVSLLNLRIDKQVAHHVVPCRRSEEHTSKLQSLMQL